MDFETIQTKWRLVFTGSKTWVSEEHFSQGSVKIRLLKCDDSDII